MLPFASANGLSGNGPYSMSPGAAATAGVSATGWMVVASGPPPAGGVTVTVTDAPLAFFTCRKLFGPAGMVSAPAEAGDMPVLISGPPRLATGTGVSAAKAASRVGG